MYPLLIGLVLVMLEGCGPSWQIVGHRPGMTREAIAAVGDYCMRSLPPSYTAW